MTEAISSRSTPCGGSRDPGRAAQKRTQPRNCRVRACVDPAGVAVENKPPLEKRFDDVDNRLMHNAIFHDRFVNRSLFWIVNSKRLVRIMPIASGHEIVAKLKKVVFERFFKTHDVGAFSFAGFEKLPSVEQVFNRGQTIE